MLRTWVPYLILGLLVVAVGVAALLGTAASPERTIHVDRLRAVRVAPCQSSAHTACGFITSTHWQSAP